MTETNGDGTNGTSSSLATLVIDVALADGRTERAHVFNADFLRWDRTAAKHGWPRFQDAGVMHTTFLVWSALRRSKQIPSTDEWSWERFSEELCLKITPVETDEEPGAVDPTLLEAVRG